MKTSARNSFNGVVKQVIFAGVHDEIVLDIGNGLLMTAMITK